MPNIWLSALSKDQDAIQKIMTRMKTYGISVLGHFWANDNAKMAWKESLSEARAKENAAWAILATREELLNEDLRYGLSMSALCLGAERGAGFPIIVLQSTGELFSADDFPTPLQRAVILPVDAAGTPAKIVARIHAKAIELPADYYINMVGNPHIGQWLEIRPTGGAWPGIIFGIDQGSILFQAVGPAGGLPDKSTLHHAMQGLQLELGERKFTAWAVQNEISPQSAYFVKIEGTPASILFGPYAQDDQTELFNLSLK